MYIIFTISVYYTLYSVYYIVYILIESNSMIHMWIILYEQYESTDVELTWIVDINGIDIDTTMYQTASADCVE